MDAEIKIEVPGKCMIAGEYGVLAPGGSAIAFTVAPGLVVHARESEQWGISRTDLGIEWVEGGTPDKELLFAHKALLRGRSMLSERNTPLSFTISSGTKGMSGARKAGLGGSAATVVGVLTALFELSGFRLSQEAFLQAAHSVHQAAQQGRGSGYDIATIATGGLVYWTPDTQVVESLAWPEGLHCLSGFSGRSAHTPTLIESSERVATVGPLQEAASLLKGAFKGADISKVLSSIAHCQTMFLEWNQRHKLGLWTKELTTLGEIASDSGVVTRVSGAGGGDTLLAFTENQALLEGLAFNWKRAGFDSALRRPSKYGPKKTD
jgi:phosphomevalonate kinase